jgi:hypothetical protein
MSRTQLTIQEGRPYQPLQQRQRKPESRPAELADIQR